MWFKKRLPENITKRESDRLTAFIGFSYSDMNLVGQYENAVDILINQVIDEKNRVDTIAHPLLYLMRHSIELGLKVNIKYLSKYSKLPIIKYKTHTLSDLFTEFEKHYKKIATENHFETELKNDYDKYSDDLKEVIKSLGDNWSSFRYIYDVNGKKVFADSETLNIYDLKMKYDNSIIFITHTSDAISPYTDLIDYLNYDKSIKNQNLGFVKYCLDLTKKDWLIEKLNSKYKIEVEKNIWFDEVENHFLHLKLTNDKCYVIPMKKS